MKISSKIFANPPKWPVAAKIAGIIDVDLVNGVLVEKSLDLSIDSQIHFRLKEYIGRTAALAQIEVDVAFCSTTLTPRLYLNYGAGFRPETSVSLSRVGKIWLAFVPLPHLLVRGRLDLFEDAGQVILSSLIVRRASALEFANFVLRKGIEVAEVVAGRRAQEAIRYLANAVPTLSQSDETTDQAAIATLVACAVNSEVKDTIVADAAYLAWIRRHEKPNEEDVGWMNEQSANWNARPLLSVLMPVYNPPLELLEQAVRSLQAQVYINWELCIADDCSSDPEIRACIERLAIEEPRIRYIFREYNGHISEASNSASELAVGDFIVLMDNDDILPSHALWTVAYYINYNPTASLFYSDEDKINTGGTRCEPYHKGGFDRFLLYGHNMFSHLGIYRRSLFQKVGGFRKGYEGSQDYDLTLRCLDEVGEKAVVHIPHVLYHWRQIPGSTSMGAGQKSYAFEAAKRAIDEHFIRNGYPLVSVDADVPGIAAVQVLSTTLPKMVSIVIPTRDGATHLRRCIKSLVNFPDPLTEIIIIDNGSRDDETVKYLLSLSRDTNRFRVIRVDEPFNFSRLVNLGVEMARGEIICLLNDDTEVLVPGIFERARAWLAIADIGIIGARLLYPDGTIQHFGIHIGVGPHGIAEHCYLGIPDNQHVNFSKNKLLQQFSAVTGACLFMRRDDYLSIGGCDEDLPVAYNDIDLCLRVRATGLKVICDPEIKLIHYESKSRGHDKDLSKKKRLDNDAKKVRQRWGREGLLDQFYSSKFSTEHSVFVLGETSQQLSPWKCPKDVVGRYRS